MLLVQTILQKNVLLFADIWFPYQHMERPNVYIASEFPYFVESHYPLH
jgi:hypothetical protein